MTELCWLHEGGAGPIRQVDVPKKLRYNLFNVTILTACDAPLKSVPLHGKFFNILRFRTANLHYGQKTYVGDGLQWFIGEDVTCMTVRSSTIVRKSGYERVRRWWEWGRVCRSAGRHQVLSYITGAWCWIPSTFLTPCSWSHTHSLTSSSRLRGKYSSVPVLDEHLKPFLLNKPDGAVETTNSHYNRNPGILWLTNFEL